MTWLKFQVGQIEVNRMDEPKTFFKLYMYFSEAVAVKSVHHKERNTYIT